MPKRRTSRRTKDEVGALVARHIQQLVAELDGAVRRQLAAEAAAYFGNEQGPSDRRAAKRARPKSREKRVLPCIAPLCKNPSKGPRFHYLCEQHQGAAKKDYAGWRAARREKTTAPST